MLDTLAWGSCWTLFLNTLSWHSCWTLLLDTLDTTFLLDTLAGHSYLTLLLDTPAGHSWHTWQDTPARHFCFDTPAGHSYRTLLLDTLSGHSLLDTLSGHSCWTLLLDTLACLSCQDTLANQTKLSKRAFSMRLSPKVTIQASKTSIFHETFTKSDNPSFQNERFPRDFHQKRQSKLPKRAFSTRLSPKVTIQASKTSVFHETSTRLSPKVTIQPSKTSVLHETSRKSELRSKHSALQIPMEQRDSTPRKHHPETANPNITATQTSHFHETLRLCSEITFFNLQVYNVRRLPRKMSFVTFLKTCKIVTFPSVWNDFDNFCSHTLTAKSAFYLRLVTKTELFKPPCNCKSQWNSAIQHL